MSTPSLSPLRGFHRRIPVELPSTGIPELDLLLQGGLPRGALIELCGTSSSGRTSVSFSLLAQATARHETCAYVDVSDSLDPTSLAAAGADLARVLWIRCGELGTKNPAKQSVATPKSDAISTRKITQGKANLGMHGWTHPRDQIRGIENAIPSVIGKAERNKSFSWKVKSTAPLVMPTGGQDALSSRILRAADLCRESQMKANRFPRKPGNQNKPWRILEQALKVTDLLIHAGGWGVVVLDFGNISWVHIRRIELSTWFRFRRALESTPTILLLLGEDSCSKSCSSLVLQCERKSEQWNSTRTSCASSELTTFQGFQMEGQILSSRIGLPPMSSTQWATQSSCSNNF